MPCDPCCTWENLIADQGLSSSCMYQVTCSKCHETINLNVTINPDQAHNIIKCLILKIQGMEEMALSQEEITKLRMILDMEWMQKEVDETIAETLKIAKANNIRAGRPNAPWSNK